jgi:hypothetical protein
MNGTAVANRGTKRRLLISATLVTFALASAPGATPASAAPHTAAALTLKSADFTAQWHESRMTGSIVLTGSASQKMRVTVGWFPAQLLAGQEPKLGPKAPRTASFKVGRAKFKWSVHVSGLFPGRFQLAGYGRGGSSLFTIPGRVVVLAAPPEGVIGRAYVSATVRGRPVNHLPAGSKAIYAHYVWAPGGYPARPVVRQSWSGPTGPCSPACWGSNYTASKSVFIAKISAKRGRTLPSGMFRHVLRVLDRPVARVSVRVG